MLGARGVTGRIVLLVALAIAASVTTVVAGDDVWLPKPPPPVDEGSSEEYWWEGEPLPWGAITASYVFSNYSDSPSPSGVRLSFGPMGIGDEYYGWLDFWVSYREAEDDQITSIGVSEVPLACRYRRVAIGWLFNAGFERLADPDRYVLAGIIGIGGDFVVRLFRHWDFVSSAEIDYRTTVEAETQLRVAIRFHHSKLGGMWKNWWKERKDGAAD
jgi:hypothetical protein